MNNTQRALPYSGRMSIDVDDTPMTFGKYCGQTPLQILEHDPSYLCWLYEVVTPQYLSKPLYDAAQTYLYDDEDDGMRIEDYIPDIGDK